MRDGVVQNRRPDQVPLSVLSAHTFVVEQIVLQDASEDEPPVSVPVPVNEVNEDSQEEDEDRGGAIPEKERRFYRPWEIDGPPHMWERENMHMGLGPMPNMLSSHGNVLIPGHRMDVDGPGSFPVGPGMPLLQPGPNPNFGMFPAAPFPPPSAGRYAFVWTSVWLGSVGGLNTHFASPLLTCNDGCSLLVSFIH